jgi:hypothetical protein
VCFESACGQFFEQRPGLGRASPFKKLHASRIGERGFLLGIAAILQPYELAATQSDLARAGLLDFPAEGLFDARAEGRENVERREPLGERVVVELGEKCLSAAASSGSAGTSFSPAIARARSGSWASWRIAAWG